MAMSETGKRKLTVKSIVWLLFKIYILVFLLVLLVWGIHLGRHAFHLFNLVKSVQENGTQVESSSIISQVQDAADDIAAIHQELSPLFPIFNALQGLPGVGPYLGQVDPMLTFANDLAQAGREIGMGVEPLLNQSAADPIPLSLPERLSQVLEAGYLHLNKASDSIEQADQVRSRIRSDLLPGSIRPLFEKLDGNFALLRSGVQMLKVSPDLLGAGGAQSYLILAQNRDELRATGGFISGIGLLTLEHGKIQQFNLGDSYLVDDFSKPYPQPPEAIKRFMLADYWVTRDANWSPDFPTTAQQAQNLYTLSTGIGTQGVIAFNQLAIKDVLAVIGPLQVPGTDEPVSAENVEEYMRQAWAPAPEEGLSDDWWLHRKDFMQLLGNELLEKALSIKDQAQLLGLARTLVDLLDQGQILVYFSDLEAEAALEIGGWDGAVHPGESDYLFAVDSNVGFNKVDSVVQRSLAYKVDLSDLTRPTAEVTMNYQHTGNGNLPCKQVISYGTGTYKDMQQRCYLDYWRVYVPGGSKLLASNTHPVPADELLSGTGWSGQVESLEGEAQNQVFAGLLMVPVASSAHITLSYSLPTNVIIEGADNLFEYTLQVQVQPGLDGLPFKFEVRLPDNSSLVNLGEGWKSLDDHIWAWQGYLEHAREVNLSIQSIQNP